MKKPMADVTSLVSRIFHPGFQTASPATATFVRFRPLSNGRPAKSRSTEGRPWTRISRIRANQRNSRHSNSKGNSGGATGTSAAAASALALAWPNRQGKKSERRTPALILIDELQQKLAFADGSGLFSSPHDMKPINKIPVFALDTDSTWDDLLNAMQSSVRFQTAARGQFFPLFFFAPMREPENPDTWEPLKTLPENLLMISIARHIDERVLKALMRAKSVCGETRQAASFPSVRLDFERPLANVYEQMAAAGIRSFVRISPGQDDPSFFFLRGAVAVKAFGVELPKATH